MSNIVKRYLFRVYLLAAIAIVMGVALSLLVYTANEKVRENAVDLVDSRIPILISINQLIADLSEQERIIYEYYRSQNGSTFLNNFEMNRRIFLMHSTEISNHPMFKKESDFLLLQQENIVTLAFSFHKEMLKNSVDWDYLREILTNVSDIRLGLLPSLHAIEKRTKSIVEEGHSATLTQMINTRNTVIFYGVGIIFFAGVIFWYIKQYVRTSAKNTRLALFSERNPKPILSVNNLGDIVFSNPACKELLESVGYEYSDLIQLLPANFNDIRQELSRSEQPSMIIEQYLKDKVLQINVNWVKEADAYEIHIDDITQRKFAEQSVKHLAFYVQETNLPNQYKLKDDVDAKVTARSSFSLGFFEVKKFSQLVSFIGSETVTELIKAMVNIVTEALPNGVSLYQVTAKRFALLSSKALSPSASQGLSQKLLDAAEKPIIAAGGEFFIELDFGFCNFPQHGENKDTLFKNAHTALLLSIEDDHKKYSLFQSEFSDAIEKQAAITDNLRHAIADEELFLVFQPQLHLKTHRITGVETLVRWRHKGEFVSPAHFIPLAEQSGLIVPIGQWILINACKFAKKLVDLGYEDIVVAVNVSPRQFSHPSFFQSVVDAMNTAKLSAKNLELEITEGVVMHNEENTLAVLHQLKALGVQLSIDDFGTGYSSLSYLKRFPVDKLKIDQSFVFGCHENSEDRAIIQTIVSLGKNLGLTLIAEGVEEVAHVEFLTSLECHEIQGYWYSKPLEEKDLLTFLEKESNNVLLTTES